tara:strand:+ start:44 stop:172 length:129 start_codon:yes stop_codon:yes gene_type:complete
MSNNKTTKRAIEGNFFFFMILRKILLVYIVCGSRENRLIEAN